MAVVLAALFSVVSSAQEFADSPASDASAELPDSLSTPSSPAMPSRALPADGSALLPRRAFVMPGGIGLPFPEIPRVPSFSTADVRLAPAALSGGHHFQHNPFSYDFSRSGVLASWRNGVLVGSGSRITMPGLLSDRTAAFTAVHTAGSLTLTAGVSADRYLLWQGTRTVFTAGGSATWRLGDNVSATVFGTYSTARTFYSMAAMPYFPATGYGGFFTFSGGAFGVDLGVERHYDTFARRWVTSPIVTPKVRVSEKFTLELPVGWLIREMLDEAVFGDRRNNGPIIMPEALPMPGPIPFPPPEIKYQR